jgi:hypothetical protein
MVMQNKMCMKYKMCIRIENCINSLIAKTIYFYKFSVFSFYFLEKTILGPESDDEDDMDYDTKYYTGRTPLANDIENIIPKLE